MEKRVVHPADLEAELLARLVPRAAPKRRQARRVRRPHRALLALTAVMSLLVLTIGNVGATITSEFEITDANVVDDPINPAIDWDTILGPGNVPAAGAPDPTEFIVDPLAFDPLVQCDGDGDPTVFTGAGGEKNGDAFNTMTWGAGSVPSNKDDLSNVYIHGRLVDHDGDGTTPEHFVIYFGLERVDNNGSSHVDFEFLQSQIGLVVTGQDAAGCDLGTFSGTRTVGDILITINFENGGALGTPEFRVWNGTAYVVAAPAAGAAGVVSNTIDVACGDWTCRDTDGDATNTLVEQAFVEGFLDTADPSIDLSGCLTSFNAHTRSSPPITATLKDFALGSFANCDLTVDKTGDTISKVGDAANYTITITNTGIVPLYKEDISDTLLGAITVNGVDQANPLITGNTCGASLAPGASCTITASRTVLAGDPDPLPNTVSVTYDSEAGLLSDEVTRSDSHSVNLFQPSVTIDKTGNATSKVGDPVDYVITVTNTSSADTPTLNCTVTDTLLGAIGTPSLTPGQSAVFNRQRIVAGGDPDPLVNTASVTCSPTGFPNVLNASDGHSVQLFGPSVTIVKTGDTLSKIGDSVDYTITVTNTSSADTPNLVCNVTDTLFGSIATNLNLASGANAVFNRTRAVVAGDPDPLVNTASVTCSPVGFPNVINASDGHTVNLFQPSVTIDKTGDTLSKVSDPVSYTITVNNTSSADSPNLVCNVTDTLLGSIATNVSLPSGGTAVFNRTRTVAAGDPDPLVNTASVTCSPVGFPNVLNASDGHSVNLFQPSVTITKTGDAFTKATDVVTYTIVVSNTSSADTPALSCNINDTLLGAIGSATLNSGQNATFTRSRTTLAADPDPLVNTATATCSPAEFPNVLTVSDGHSSDVLHPAFTVAKTCLSTQPVPQEGPATFRVTLTNTGDATLVFNVDDGIGTVNLAAGASQNFNVVVNGPFSGQATVSNTVNATITLDPTYQLSNTYTATATGTCNVGSRVEVEKTVNGVVDPTKDLVFEIYLGPDGFDSGNPPIATDSTLGDADGVLEFNLLNLDPTLTYTICERNIPAGWNDVWTVNGNPIVSYNPDADNPVPEDLGNRCVDFGAGTTIPLTAGGTLRFVVDNEVPQGDARTPGYWKNWSSCTGGNQYAKAIAKGGGANGFWTLDELLANPGFQIGDMILDGVWNNDPFLFQNPPLNNDCIEAVRILDKSDALTGKKKASDAAYNLATALFAAKLNVAAGAGTCAAATTAINQAQALLDQINFTGTGDYLGSKVKGALATLRAQALALQATLDAYNNNLLC